MHTRRAPHGRPWLCTPSPRRTGRGGGGRPGVSVYTSLLPPQADGANRSVARCGLAPSRWRPIVRGRGARPRLPGSASPCCRRAPTARRRNGGGAGSGGTGGRRRVGRDTGGHLVVGRGPGGGRRYRRKAPHALPGGGGPCRGRGRACLLWGQRRLATPRQAVLRPGPAPGVPCAVRPRASPRDPGAECTAPCILAHDPPDLGRAWLGRRPPARVRSP